MPPTANLEALTCSFCNKNQSEVAKLVAGPGVYICNECIDLCDQIIAEEVDRKTGGGYRKPARSSRSRDPPPIKAWEGSVRRGPAWRRWYVPMPPTRTSTVLSLVT